MAASISPIFGLSNGSNYCYFNAVFQCLARIDELITLEGTSKIYETSIKNIRELANGSEVLRTPIIGITRFKQYVLNKFPFRFVADRQEDFGECLTAILELFPKVTEKLCGYKECSKVTCKVCKHKSKTREIIPFLQLHAGKHDSSLTSFIEEYMHRETIKDYACEGCERAQQSSTPIHSAATKKIKIVSVNKYLFVVLNRNTYRHKELSRVDFMEEAIIKDKPYELVAIAVHLGNSTESGHYKAYIKRREQWYETNDSIIREVPTIYTEEILHNGCMFLYERTSSQLHCSQ